MKYLLLLLFLPGMAFGQIQDSIPNTSFLLQDKEVIFSKVYSSALNKAELIEKLKRFLPSVKSFQLTGSPNQAQDQFSGKLTGFIVNYKKFGGSALGLPSFVKTPFSANAIIQVKDNKYRVIIRDIAYEDDPDIFLADVITKNKRSTFRVNDSSLLIATFTDKDLSTSFDIATAKTEDF